MWCPNYPEGCFRLIQMLFLKFLILSKDLDPVALSVTHIDQAVVADDHTMHNLHERTTHTRIGLFLCPLVPH